MKYRFCFLMMLTVGVLYNAPSAAMNTISFMDNCESGTYCCHDSDLTKVLTETVYNDCSDGYTLRNGACVCDTSTITDTDERGTYTITFPSYAPGSRTAYVCTPYFEGADRSGLACVACRNI